GSESISSAGAHTHTLTIDSAGAHTHTFTTGTTGDHTHTLTGDSETAPNHIVLNAFICINQPYEPNLGNTLNYFTDGSTAKRGINLAVDTDVIRTGFSLGAETGLFSGTSTQTAAIRFESATLDRNALYYGTANTSSEDVLSNY